MFLHLYSYIKNFLPGHYKTFQQILIKWFLEYKLLGLKTKVNERWYISTVQFNSIQKLIQKSHNSWKREREEKATNYLNFIVKNIVAKTFISFSLNVERFYNFNDYGNISVGLLVLQGSSGLHRAGGDGSDKIRDPIYFWRETDHRTREPLVQADAVRLNARASSRRMGSIQYKISYEKIKSSFSRCENT